jgi:hypothetical protein
MAARSDDPDGLISHAEIGLTPIAATNQGF